MLRREFIGAVAAATIISRPSLLDARDNKPCLKCMAAKAKPVTENKKVSWGQRTLGYAIFQGDTDDLNMDIWRGEIEAAFASWSKHTNLFFQELTNPRAMQYAHIGFSVGNSPEEKFGSKNGVLGWAYMPTEENFIGQLLCKFDLAEQWVLEPEEFGICLRTVAAHEIGHLLGLYHSESKDDLMYPSYTKNFTEPQRGDVKALQSIYGKPARNKERWLDKYIEDMQKKSK